MPVLVILWRFRTPLALIAVIVGLFAAGVHWKAERIAHAAELAKLHKEVATARYEAAIAQATVKVVTKYVDRIVKVQGVTRVITKEIPVYVTSTADAGCVIPAGFVRVHDAAAAGVVPQPAGDPDAPAPGVALSTVAETVTDNYGVAHEIAAQLTALQDWIRAQQALTK